MESRNKREGHYAGCSKGVHRRSHMSYSACLPRSYMASQLQFVDSLRPTLLTAGYKLATQTYLAADVEAAKVEYVVIKKSTGEVVGTFDTEGPALEMIEKARKQKKAALQLL